MFAVGEDVFLSRIHPYKIRSRNKRLKLPRWTILKDNNDQFKDSQSKFLLIISILFHQNSQTIAEDLINWPSRAEGAIYMYIRCLSEKGNIRPRTYRVQGRKVPRRHSRSEF